MLTLAAHAQKAAALTLSLKKAAVENATKVLIALLNAQNRAAQNRLQAPTVSGYAQSHSYSVSLDLQACEQGLEIFLQLLASYSVEYCTMKYTTLLSVFLISSFTLESAFAKKPAVLRKDNKQQRRAENATIREELKLDHQDQHQLGNAQLKDVRAKNLATYHKHTLSRINHLLRTGAITEEQGSTFKDSHALITSNLKIAKADSGTLSADDKAAARQSLDTLNDTINSAITTAETGDKRTPLFNAKQNKLEQLIEAGQRNGRLSTGEASRLRRKLDSLNRLEDRIKNGEKLSEREREKLHKEAAELRREIYKELKD